MPENTIFTNPKKEERKPKGDARPKAHLDKEKIELDASGPKRNYFWTVIIIIAIIVVIASIVTYAQNRAKQDAKEGQETANTQVQGGEVTAKEENAGENKPAENVEKDSGLIPDSFEEEAISGDGITHLARKALKDYLIASGTNETLTPEQKVYIEDYLQNRKGTYWLSVGDKLTFQTKEIEEAISAAKGLNSAQLDNLKQYSQKVSTI